VSVTPTSPSIDHGRWLQTLLYQVRHQWFKRATRGACRAHQRRHQWVPGDRLRCHVAYILITLHHHRGILALSPTVHMHCRSFVTICRGVYTILESDRINTGSRPYFWTRTKTRTRGDWTRLHDCRQLRAWDVLSWVFVSWRRSFQDICIAPFRENSRLMRSELHMLTRDRTVLQVTRTFIHEWNQPSCLYSLAAAHHRTTLAGTHFPSHKG